MISKPLLMLTILAVLVSCGAPMTGPQVKDQSRDLLETEASEEPVEVSTVPAEELPEELLRQAEVFYDKAQSAVEADQPGSAKPFIDQALGNLVAINEDEADSLIQKKDDLLLRLSHLVISLYEPQTPRGKARTGPIEIVINPRVLREIESFVGREREFFLSSYKRAGQYLPMIYAELEKRGMPRELAWLALVESGFKARAFSRAGAVGMWQFILSTGKRYGLQRNDWVDERMDPVKATRAGLDHLLDLYSVFDDWLLALAAYNSGQGRVLRAMNYQGSDNFWSLNLPRETERYVPRFMATLAILANPAQYGMDLPPQPATPVVEEFIIDRPVHLGDVARLLNMEQGELQALNPGLRNPFTPPSSYALKIPAGATHILSTRLETIPNVKPEAMVFWKVHRVRRGDTLSGLARRYGTSVKTIRRSNRLRSNLIRVGQRLKIPTRSNVRVARVSRSAPQRPVSKPTNNPEDTTATVTYRVRYGDSLWAIARRNGISIDEIRAWNDLPLGAPIYPGQQLTIKTRKDTREGVVFYAVSSGDTLYSISRAYSVSIQDLMKWNNLENSRIRVGQQLKIYLSTN